MASEKQYYPCDHCEHEPCDMSPPCAYADYEDRVATLEADNERLREQVERVLTGREEDKDAAVIAARYDAAELKARVATLEAQLAQPREACEREKQTRIKYQGLVYGACNLIERKLGWSIRRAEVITTDKFLEVLDRAITARNGTKREPSS